jgi:hypothetical protein
MKLVEYTRRAFLTHLNYGATGEGNFDEINYCYADNEAEAIEKHLDRFGYKNIGKDKTREYFKPGIVVTDAKSLEAKKILAKFFKDGNQMFHIMKDAAVDLYFRFHSNHS